MQKASLKGYLKKLKERLDILLVERGYFETRERAKASIMAGVVFVDGNLSDKAGTKIDTEAVIEVREDTCPYAGRGGLKLEKAIKSFQIDLTGKNCIDIGASTGGFTDCMLQSGAAKVYSVDVGYGQLAWKLRNDPRVVNMEKTNFRYLDPETIPEKLDFAGVDVSFISLKHILPVAAKVLNNAASAVCLVKPQFEAGREEMKNSKGIVRDPEVRRKAILDVCGYARENGFYPAGLSWSPIRGAKGNIEFLLYLTRDPASELEDITGAAADIAAAAHEELEGNK